MKKIPEVKLSLLEEAYILKQKQTVSSILERAKIEKDSEENLHFLNAIKGSALMAMQE